MQLVLVARRVTLNCVTGKKMEATIEFPMSTIAPITFPLLDGKYVINKGYLERRLGALYKLCSFNAVVSVDGDVPLLIPMKEHLDIEGNVQFIVDASISCHYNVISQEKINDKINSTAIPIGRFGVRGHSHQPTYGLQNENGASQPILLDEETTDAEFDLNTPLFREHMQSATLSVESDSPIKCYEQVSVEVDDDFASVENNKSTGLEGSSVIPMIISQTRSTLLSRLIKQIPTRMTVEEILRFYDGDIVFEFSPTFNKVNSMNGMEQKFDGHTWTKPITSNVAFEGVVRVSYCAGVFQCLSVSCPHKINNGHHNRTFFKGLLKKKCPLGYVADFDGSITCHFCKRHATCVDTCSCILYYVMPNNETLTRLMIHSGKHLHDVQPGTSKMSIENTRLLVERAVKADKNAGPRKVQMMIARDLISSTLTKPDRLPNEVVGDLELGKFLDELIPLVQNRRYIIINK